MKKKLSRRTFLRGALGTAVSLPFLEAMLKPSRSVAQAVDHRKVIFFFTGCGPNPDTWWPDGTGADFRLRASLAPLEPMRDRLLLLDGISMRTAIERRGDGGNGHDVGTAHALTARPIVEGPDGVGRFGHLWDGTAGGISIDQHMANAIGGDSTFRSLEVGVRAEGIEQSLPSRISYRGRGEPVVPLHSAGATFDRVFAPLSTEGEAAARLQRRRQMMLGSVQGSLSRLRRDLGSEDRRRVDAHVSALHDIAGRLDSFEGRACDIPDRSDSGDYRELGELQLDLVARAMACDLTRVASIQWSTGQSGVRFSDLGHSNNHHSISHKGISDAAGQRESTEIDAWYATRFLHLLQALDSVENGRGGTVLDDTCVVWVNEQERGIGNQHTWRRMPYILAGGFGGAVRTGRHMDAGGRGHADIFVSLMQGLGMPDTTFGEADLCDGPITLT